MRTTVRNGTLWMMLFTLVLCLIMSAPGMCASTGTVPFGWISPQGKTIAKDANSRNIEGGLMDENMNYYYSDSDALPNALIKLSKEYTLDDPRWKPITDPETLTAFMQYLKLGTAEEPSGALTAFMQYLKLKTAEGTSGAQNIRSFTMKAYDARPIGTWYANHYVYGMRLYMSKDNRLSLFVPKFTNDNTFFVKRNSDNLLADTWTGARAFASSDLPAYVFMENDPKFFHKTSRTEKVQALEYARIAFNKATAAGGEKAAPYEYYMAKEYLDLAKDEFSEGDEISVIPFAAESRQYSLRVVDKTKGEAQ